MGHAHNLLIEHDPARTQKPNLAPQNGLSTGTNDTCCGGILRFLWQTTIPRSGL
jgi:hypothetical protein